MALSRIQAAASGTVMFWGAKISPKEPYSRTLPYILTISLASLDPSTIPASDHEPVVLKAVVGNMEDEDSDDEVEKPEPMEIILCTLRPHSTNQVSIDFVLETHTDVTLKVEGKHELCVTGYFTIEDQQDFAPEDLYGGEFDENELADAFGDESDDDDGLDEVNDDDDDDDSEEEKATKEMMKAMQAQQAKKPTQQPQKPQQQQQKQPKQETKKPATKAEKEEPKKRKAEEGKGGEEGGNKKQKAAAAAQPPAPQAAVTATQKVKKFPNGLVVEELKEGQRKEATKGSAVTIDYKGQLTNGKVFDSGKKLKFKVGRGEVISGMEQGIMGMKVGGKRKITIPPSLGYGLQKIPGIPPNSTLVFTIDLVASI